MEGETQCPGEWPTLRCVGVIRQSAADRDRGISIGMGRSGGRRLTFSK